ncbi:MAG: CerR family C-terminal domain-containing protein [Nitrospirota bacterium]|nr:CerR family C-terminal domain-containing protein [Nitrospirota bacterium]
MPSATVDTTDTRQRLLDAAGKVFAEKGFRSATIREICKRAKANVAAVNYHFGDKERFYAEVLGYAHRCALEKYPPHLGLAETATAEERLTAFVRSFLLRVLDNGRPAWHGKLMLREMAEPTAALDRLVEESIRPNLDLLRSIVTDLLGDAATDDDVRASASSIVAQCLFYYQCRPVITRLNPQQSYDPAAIDRLADHITRFSLGGLRHRAEERRRERS